MALLLSALPFQMPSIRRAIHRMTQGRAWRTPGKPDRQEPQTRAS
jgi:hypothetical protein